MIEAIAIAIAALGVMMLLILYSRIRALNDEIALPKHRSTASWFASFINYA